MYKIQTLFSIFSVYISTFFFKYEKPENPEQIKLKLMANSFNTVTL